MKIYVPDYYKDFRCLAGDCKHSCCIGWEIDIDEDTLDYYKSVEGEFGERLKNNISYNDETAYFAMDSCGRCPFLNKKGLCDIMINLGFDKVSQICDDHPRFRNFYSDREEIGLGMSCEAVAMQILARREKFALEVLEEGEELLWPEEEDFLDFRNQVFEILTDRAVSTADRIEKLAELAEIDYKIYSPAQQAELFSSLERLDTQWDATLEQLKNCDANNISLPENELYETALEQLCVYFAFRHLTESLDDDRLKGRIGYIVHSYHLIKNLWAVSYTQNCSLTIEEMAEICRAYSAETEYSPDNMEVLFEHFDK